jgi:hypothetical protein
MANKRKSGYLIVIRGLGTDGKRMVCQDRCRTHEKLSHKLQKIRGRKDMKVINYEVWHFTHIQKVSIRRVKKCDG